MEEMVHYFFQIVTEASGYSCLSLLFLSDAGDIKEGSEDFSSL